MPIRGYQDSKLVPKFQIDICKRRYILFEESSLEKAHVSKDGLLCRTPKKDNVKWKT